MLEEVKKLKFEELCIRDVTLFRGVPTENFWDDEFSFCFPFCGSRGYNSAIIVH